MNANMGFLKWHGGSNERKKDVPTSAQSYQDVQRVQKVFIFYIFSKIIILKSDTENVYMYFIDS